jgi:hypothetical protein
MAEIVRFVATDGSSMLVETSVIAPRATSDVGLVVEPADGGVAKATARLEDSLGSVRGAATALMSTVNEMKQRADTVSLDEVSLDLALSLGVEGGLVVAKGSAKAEVSVTLTWRSETTEK